MTSLWKTRLHSNLVNKFGKKTGDTLNEKYKKSFPPSYYDEHSPAEALKDILELEKLNRENRLEISLYQLPSQTENFFHLKLYELDYLTPLSDILPMLENLDLRTFNEYPYEIKLTNNTLYWVRDFIVTFNSTNILELKKIKSLFHDAVIHIRNGQCEDDGFNKLILNAEISWREASIIRAYAKYSHQIGLRFSQLYIEQAVEKHAAIIKKLINLFKLKFNPQKKASLNKKIISLDDEIKNSLDAIPSLDEDRILRSLWMMIKATLRTNYFQVDQNNQLKKYLALKLKSAEIPELPLPHPLYEIFVYSPRFEAIHLRGAKVSRGGIRWSDRREDFRTEILALMKAQHVKNAVIVPGGAKGGFALKNISPSADISARVAEAVICYSFFIRGLLDLTDNIINDKIVHPTDVICYDDEDTYLVVAADKGTASFSDIANNISKEYNFWLGDAFASGGSQGYDHKKMGITARGVWESIKRHFRELSFDAEKNPFTVVGIGDMSGDVFGNGMMYSPQIKLVAAFDHRNIFFDPEPNPEASYKERIRLFNLPRSSWEDYNPKLISPGGGVFKRSNKFIQLSPEVKKVLATEADTLTPSEVIQAILKAPVDLLFNGGIGTYVKSSSEKNSEVSDKSNELCRVNGEDLRCKIVGEGGNLGFTQLGRIEFALRGGLINTDFIDNSAGVDCSDHEVNIKILLDKQVKKNKLSEIQRNKLLIKMTDNVAQLVLHDNYAQAFAMSFSALHSAHYTMLYINYMKDLETSVHLNRTLEFLPDEKQLLERKSAGLGLTRPEIAVLLAYAKIQIKMELLKSDLPEDPYFISMLEHGFPQEIIKLFPEGIKKHILHREITATQLSNFIVNMMGTTFVYRLQVETGASVSEIARAHIIAANTYKATELNTLVDSLSFKIPVNLQYELFYHIRQLINLATRWFLRSNRLQGGTIANLIKHYQSSTQLIQQHFSENIVGITKEYYDATISQFTKYGIEQAIAERLALARSLYTGLNIIEVATENNFDLIKTTKMYLTVGHQFNLVWFRDQLAHDAREGHWNTMARLSLRDELDVLQRRLTLVILKSNKKELPAKEIISEWLKINYRINERWEKVLALLHASSNFDYSMFFIALRELVDLLQVAPKQTASLAV